MSRVVTIPTSTLQISLPTHIDRGIFLRKYWQRRPLLMRAALPTDCFSLSAEELAGLACEEEFESRLITERKDGSWTIAQGPFVEEDFTSLPNDHWTLLVQDVDKFVPEVTRLMDAFDFVPGWRMDDIMISFATDQGGVGPHSDAYDVFLMQAQGRRRWRISEKPYADSDLLPGHELRILSHFEAHHDWILEPGDVLYLPPGVAHWGTAEGDCMTYSLGFRAPSQLELTSDWFQHLVSLARDRRLVDPDDLVGNNLAELTAGVSMKAATLIDDLPTTHSREFRLWLGCYLTEPKPQFQIAPPDSPWQAGDLDQWLQEGTVFTRHPCARMAWARLSDHEVALFCQGEAMIRPAGLIEAVKQLAQRRRIEPVEAGNPELRDLLLELVNAGILEPGE